MFVIYSCEDYQFFYMEKKYRWVVYLVTNNMPAQKEAVVRFLANVELGVIFSTTLCPAVTYTLDVSLTSIAKEVSVRGTERLPTNRSVDMVVPTYAGGTDGTSPGLSETNIPALKDNPTGSELIGFCVRTAVADKVVLKPVRYPFDGTTNEKPSVPTSSIPFSGTELPKPTTIPSKSEK
jgi:hypothetical protein